MELILSGNFFEPSAIRLATLKQTLQRILKKRVRNPTILTRVRKLFSQETFVSSAFQYVRQPGFVCLVGMQTVAQSGESEFVS